MEKQKINEWFADKGDLTHNLNHDLDENSIVMDLGAYGGLWAYQLLQKHPKCKVYLIEPVPKFFEACKNNFSDNSNVQCRMVGVSKSDQFTTVELTGDATKSNSSGDVTIELVSIENIMDHWNLEKIDLLQINIEGDEYELLEHWISTGIITKFKTLQIQFHFSPIGPSDSDDRKKKIQESLSHIGYTQKFNYNYVWECWEYNAKK